MSNDHAKHDEKHEEPAQPAGPPKKRSKTFWVMIGIVYVPVLLSLYQCGTEHNFTKSPLPTFYQDPVTLRNPACKFTSRNGHQISRCVSEKGEGTKKGTEYTQTCKNDGTLDKVECADPCNEKTGKCEPVEGSESAADEETPHSAKKKVKKVKEEPEEEPKEKPKAAHKHKAKSSSEEKPEKASAGLPPCEKLFPGNKVYQDKFRGLKKCE